MTKHTERCKCTSETRFTRRSPDEQTRLRNRLRRIEGQVRGLEKMLDADAYCIDIINQTAAVRSALNSFNKELLVRHIRTCVENDIRKGSESAVDELTETLNKLL